MARLFDDASTHNITSSSAPVSAAPMTMACWVKPDVDLQVTPFSINNNAVQTSYFVLQLDMNIAGDPVAFYVGDGSAFSNASTTTGISINVWSHICGVARSATDRSVYLNGGSRGDNATSRVPSSLNAVGIGFNNRPATQRYFSGDLAEFAVWDIDLSDPEIAALGKGISALLIRPQNLVFYAPIIGKNSPELELINGSTLTVSGTSASAHPPVQRTKHRPLLDGYYLNPTMRRILSKKYFRPVEIGRSGTFIN